MAGLSGHTSGAAVVGVTISLTALAALVVFTRLFTRICVVKEPGLDDGFIVAALIFSIATTVTMCLQVNNGMGRHIYNLTPHEIVVDMKALYVSIWVYNLAMSCTKFSILLQYLRLFPQRPFRVVCYIMMGIISVYTCWTVFSAIFACWPIPYFWNPAAHPGGHCLNRTVVWFANAGINIGTDIAIGILPLPVLKQLQLPKRQKLALMIVFALGGCTCIVSILRLQELYVVSKAKDITWQNPLAAIWSSVEINTGILCSCLPTLRKLVSRVSPKIFASRDSSAKKAGRSSENSSTDPAKECPQQSSGLARRSLEALGRSLARVGETAPADDRSKCYSQNLELEDFAPASAGQIQVVTVMEQDVEEIDVDEPPSP